jgi:hypothetical protein
MQGYLPLHFMSRCRRQLWDILLRRMVSHIGPVGGSDAFSGRKRSLSEIPLPRGSIESASVDVSEGHQAMRNWTTKEVKVVLQWAREPDNERTHIDEIAAQLSRSTRAVQEFLRRLLPEGQRPWAERPRWGADEIAALQLDVGTVSTRSAAAIRQYVKRHQSITATVCSDEDSERTALSVTQVATDLGLS